MAAERHQGTLVVTRPPHFPTPWTRDTVQHLVACGLTVEQIATAIHATPHEVREYYAEELETGLAQINARVQIALLNKALSDGDVQAMKLWLMNKAGWRGGDGPLRLQQKDADGSSEGEMTVVQRRTTIEEVLKRVTASKRANERVIEGTVLKSSSTPVGANGNGHSNGNGANGHGANGHAKKNGNGSNGHG